MPSDVIVYWAHGGVPTDIRERSDNIFKYPIEFVQFPNPPVKVRTKSDGTKESYVAWNSAMETLGPRPINKVLKDAGVRAQRIAILGFSASCTAQRLVLDSADGGYVDSAIAIDGIHAGVDVWTDFASLAADGGAIERGCQPGERMCTITHSQVEPSYTSTTETAEQIVNGVFGGAVTKEGPPVSKMLTSWLSDPVDIGCKWHSNRYTYDKMPFWYQVNKAGLHVLGYENLDPTGCTDHIFQAKVVLPRVLEYILAPRWHEAPPSGTCVVGATV